jgi:hypothetical protein
VILFFYVDNIIMLYYSDYQEEFDQLEQQLVKLCNLRQICNVKWFLGIRVERLLASRQLYLVQDALSTRSALNLISFALMANTLLRLSHLLQGLYPTTGPQTSQTSRLTNVL